MRKYETLTIDLKHENLVDNFFWENKSIERGSRPLRTPEIGAPYVIWPLPVWSRQMRHFAQMESDKNDFFFVSPISLW